MCLQISYTLTCEHVRSQIIYCADATYAPSSSSSSKKDGSSSHSSHKKDHHKKESSGNGGSSSSSSKKKKKSSSSGPASAPSHHQHSQHSQHSQHQKRSPCRNLTQQSLPYPTPPSFACDPQTAATSLLAPKCPLPDCPFEAKNRCWNCCWCGKGWNEKGRCSCIMIIEGIQVQCEHICCPECEAA